MPTPALIELSKARLAALLGMSLPDAEVVRMLTGLGLELVAESPEGWSFKAPSYRFDIAIDADLVEELARLYGYDKLPTRTPSFAIALPSTPEASVSSRDLTGALTTRGYHEVITYSFVDPKLHAHFSAGKSVVALRNPISTDMAEMRTSLIPGLVSTLKYNLNRQQTRASLFETGLVFEQGENAYPQARKIAGLIYGQRLATSWCSAKAAVDFFDIKGDVEALLAVTRNSDAYSFVPAKACPAYLHPGQTAEVVFAGQTIGFVGALHPSTAKAMDIANAAYVFEMDLECLLTGAVPAFSPLSKYPSVSRDIAVLVDSGVSAEAMVQSIRAAAGENLKDVSLFDVYAGQGVGPLKKSLAFNLTFQNVERTLKDEEIQQAVDNVVKTLAEVYGASLR